MGARVAAVDLGASSGRVFVGVVDTGRLRLKETARFWNGPVPVAGALYTDILYLWRNVLEGIAAGGRSGDGLDSIGVDSWGVDYGLLDGEGQLIANPRHYRDERTSSVVDDVDRLVDAQEHYRRTGTARLRFNTIYQLVADERAGLLERAAHVLLIPDLMNYLLSGSLGTDLTNASTTGLLSAHSAVFDLELLARLGLSASLFPPLRHPGQWAGELRPEVSAQARLTAPLQITTVASHDTASAVVAVPAADERFAYVSCGTWSLVGVELDHPVLTEQARTAGFTNERGLDGTTRLLRNVMGLWLLSESQRTYQLSGSAVTLDVLVSEAARLAPLQSVVDPDQPRFLAPGDMPERIRSACLERGERPPRSPVENARCILDSLALAYRRSVRLAGELAGLEIERVHLVGGGAQNELLCQLTADACELPVVAGPVEAAAIGNVLVQARSLGALDGPLSELRRTALEYAQPRIYEPDALSSARFAAAAGRLDG